MIRPYKDILVDYTTIEQNLLNISNKVRSNLFSWNGQFSPQFVEVLLNYFANDKDVVIDPFAGSGTTLCECARKNIQAYGMELNPSAYHMAKMYELANKTLIERWSFVNSVDLILSDISNVDDILPIIRQKIQQEENSFIAFILCALVVLLDLYNNKLSVDSLYKKWDFLKK